MPRNGSPLRYVASRWCPAAVRGNFYFWAVRTYGLDAGSELLGARVYLLARIRDSLPFAWYGQAAASPVHCFRGKGRDPTVACACKLLGKKTLVTEEFQWKHTAGRFSVLDLLSIVTLFSFLLARVSGTPDPYIQRFNRRWTIDGAAVCRSCSYCPSCVTQLVSAAQPLW